MRSTGRREPRWIPFAVCFAVSGTAWAEGAGSTAPANMLIASIAPLTPMEVVASIPEPSQYLFHYELQYSSYQRAAAAFDPADFYAAHVATAEPLKHQGAPAFQGYQPQFRPQTELPTEPQSSAQDLGKVTTSISLLDRFQLFDDPDTNSPSHPTRRLAVMIDDWRVSASAHLPLTHSRDVGATVNVRHNF